MVTRRVTSRITAPTARRVTGDGVSAGSGPYGVGQAIFNSDFSEVADGIRLQTLGSWDLNTDASWDSEFETVDGRIFPISNSSLSSAYWNASMPSANYAVKARIHTKTVISTQVYYLRARFTGAGAGTHYSCGFQTSTEFRITKGTLTLKTVTVPERTLGQDFTLELRVDGTGNGTDSGPMITALIDGVVVAAHRDELITGGGGLRDANHPGIMQRFGSSTTGFHTESIECFSFGVSSEFYPEALRPIVQRNGSGNGIWNLQGTWGDANTPAAKVQARLLDASDDSEVVAWTDIDTAPTSAGTWSGSLLGGSASLTTSYSPEVRILDAEENVLAVNRCPDARKVGAFVVLSGQSNVARLNSRGTAVSNPANSWVFADDGTSATNPSGYDRYTFRTTFSGDGARTLAAKISTALQCPVALLDRGMGSTPLLEEGDDDSTGYWLDDSETGLLGNLLYDLNIATFGGNQIEAWVYGQGEKEAGRVSDGTSTAADYEAGLSSLLAKIRANSTGRDGANTPCVWTTLPRNSTYGTDAGWSAVRKAQVSFINGAAGVIGISQFDLPVGDGTHVSDAGFVTVGERLAAAVLGNDSPQLTSVVLNGANVELTFNQTIVDPGGSFDTQGFRVEDSDAAATIVDVTRISASVVEIELDSAASAAANVEVWSMYGRGTSITTALSQPARSITLPNSAGTVTLPILLADTSV